MNFDVESTRAFPDDLVEQAQAALTSEEQQAIEALPSGSALLIVQHGPNQGSRFLLDQDLSTAGRHPNADIFLDDVTVSRRHCEFVRAAGTFKLADLASLNGTFLNGQRVDDATLATGDEVQIGKYRFTFYASKAGAN